MKIHYTFDDSAARLPLAIRSSEGVLDRAAELRNAPGVQLVELTTQHMLNTGLSLVDELSNYFEDGNPSEADPYALAVCYANRDLLEDLLRDLHEKPSDLTAFHEVEALFPTTFTRHLHFTLALTTVGFSAFGYVRTYKDSEGEEYHGMVVNLAQARPHLESNLGQFSLSLLRDMIRYGFFNHQGFLLAYTEYCEEIGRASDKPAELLKDALMRRGIAWYLSYRHDLAFYEEALGLTPAMLADHAARWNKLIEITHKKGQQGDDVLDEWMNKQNTEGQSWELSLDVVGYFAARAIATEQGNKGLRDSIVKGADHFIRTFNALSDQKLKL